MISIENRNRLIYGIIYIIFILFGISYSSLSCSALFGLIGIICIYEMWKLRKGKTKIKRGKAITKTEIRYRNQCCNMEH